MAPFWPHFAAIAPYWHLFGDVRGLFRLASSAFAHLEPQGEPFQHHFVDLVSFLVPLLRIVDALLLKMYKILGGRLVPSLHYLSTFSIRTCVRSEAERVRCVVRAKPPAWPEDHFGCIFCSSVVAEYHLGLTSALQHCQHNGAFRFLAAQVLSDFG